MTKSISLLFLSLLLLSACSKKMNSLADQSDSYPLLNRLFELTPEYIDDINLWKENRYKSVTSPQGWLSVEGLYWLKEGENTIGRGSHNDIVLENLGLNEAGVFTLENGHLKLKPKHEAFMDSKMKPELDGTILHDGEGAPTVMNIDAYYMHVLKRGDRYGLRVKNTLAEKRFNFPEIPTYDIDANFVKYAKFVKAPIAQEMKIETVIGVDAEFKVAGYLEFLHEGRLKKLTAFEGTSRYFFVIFKDETTGTETFGGGRFLDVKTEMDENQILKLDFNKAYNPPCAFSDYATCPLPPLENQLDFSVRAGEKLPLFMKN